MTHCHELDLLLNKAMTDGTRSSTEYISKIIRHRRECPKCAAQSERGQSQAKGAA